VLGVRAGPSPSAGAGRVRRAEHLGHVVEVVVGHLAEAQA
jgi:hypothetical protein